jgi:catechol 2,3-dioxygenase
MPEPTTLPEHTSIHSDTQIGLVALTVADLQRSLRFYTEILGFTVVERASQIAALGSVEGRPLLALHELPGARPKPRAATGLYHVAVLLPSRADLGRTVQRLNTFGYPIREFEDHLVSESVYLSDPDGNGLELYRDRPRHEWPTTSDGRARMGSEPVDVPGLLAEGVRDGQPWAGLPAGTRIGHLHLQVADIAQAEAFYCGVLGFDLVVDAKTALFVSAGGYHHHVGMNIWYSRGGAPPPADAAGLRAITVHLPDDQARDAVVARLEAASISVAPHAGAVLVRDPWRNVLLLTAGAPLSATAAMAVTTIEIIP